MAGAYGIVPAMGNNLRKLREERGWTHQKAARNSCKFKAAGGVACSEGL